LVLLGGEEVVRQILDGQPAGVRPRRASGVQVVGLRPVQRERILPPVAGDALQLAVHPASPVAEVVDLAADLLHPLPAGVGREWEVGVRLLGSLRGFAGRARTGRLGHGIDSSYTGSVSAPPGHHTGRGNFTTGSING